jgi:hypothetical protein
MIRRLRPAVVSLALIASVSCGGRQSGSPSSSTSQTPPGSAGAGQNPAAGQPSSPSAAGQKAQVKPVDVELLKSFLPELAGWTKGRPRGEQMTTPYVLSNAKAHYTRGDSTIDIEITDSALNPMIFAPFAAFMAAGFDERTRDGYKKAAAIAGSPGFESWEKGPGHGEVTVIVANRFVVRASGRRVPGIDAIRRAVAAIDLRKLAALK